MTHITACILALTLTGSPVSTSLCAAVCDHESASRAECHESLAEPGAAAMSGEAICGTATTDVAYIKDDVAAPQVAAVSPPAPLIPNLTAFAPLERRIAGPVVSPWLAPPLVLRI